MEVVLAPAQHDGLHAAFGPNPFGGIGGDGRFSSSLSSLGGDRFCGYSTTTASSRFGNSPGLSSPSPRAASLSRGSSDSGSVVDDGDDAAAASAIATAAERRLRLARLALQYQEVVNRFELCLSYLADASNEAAALRRENDELRVANEDLARRINVVGCKLVDEFSGLRLAEEHAAPPPPPPPPSPLPAAPVMPKSISVRSPGYLKMNQNGKHRASKTTKGSVRSTPNPFPPMF
jgi:butyrate response factor 1